MGDTYIKLNDDLPEHRKIVAAGGDAGWLHICALAYASRNKSDGRVPKGMVPRLSDRKQPLKLAEKLCAVSLWHAAGHDCKRCDQPEVDEYLIHDYLEHQRSAEHIEAIKKKRAAAGKAGGSRKAANARGNTTAEGQQTSSNLLDAGYGSAEANTYPEAVTEGVLRTPQTDAATDVPPSPPAQAADADAPPAAGLFLIVADDSPPEPEVTTGTILGEYIDRCKKRPPDRVIGQLSKEIKKMLDQSDPIDPDDIRRGMAVWMSKGIHPSALASVVNDVMNASPPSRPGFADGTGARAKLPTPEEIANVSVEEMFRSG
jgi:hypothetical protein